MFQLIGCPVNFVRKHKIWRLIELYLRDSFFKEEFFPAILAHGMQVWSTRFQTKFVSRIFIKTLKSMFYNFSLLLFCENLNTFQVICEILFLQFFFFFFLAKFYLQPKNWELRNKISKPLVWYTCWVFINLYVFYSSSDFCLVSVVWRWHSPKCT